MALHAYGVHTFSGEGIEISYGVIDPTTGADPALENSQQH